MALYYGVVSQKALLEQSQQICDVLGHGVNKTAVAQMMGTCAAETLCAQARDKTLYGAGAGVAQVDEGTFDWLKGKFQNDKDVAPLLKDAFNVDLSKVQYRELDFSPLLSLIFCRLRYRTVTAPIPASHEERAKYWKDHYNTDAGKGSPEEYLERCRHCGVQ